MWWEILFPANKAANGSMMPPPCTRRKKSPPGHHADRGAVYHPGDDPEDASPAAAPGPRQDYAPLWAAVPGPGESLCEFGAPDRNSAVDDRGGRGRAGAHRAGTGADHNPVDRGPTDTLGDDTDHRLGYPSPDRYPIPPPHPWQTADPL